MAELNTINEMISNLINDIKQLSNEKDNKDLNSTDIKKYFDKNKVLESKIFNLTSEELLYFTEKLFKTKNTDLQLVAITFFNKQFDVYSSINALEQIAILLSYLEKWSLIDSFSPILLEFCKYDSIKVVKLLDQFNMSDNPKLQRASLTAFTKNIRYYCDFFEIILRFCDNLKFSNDPLVQKAVGITLKELLKCNKPKIKRIIKRYRKEGVHSNVSVNAMKGLTLKEKKEILKNS